jgi:hypothetical protein
MASQSPDLFRSGAVFLVCWWVFVWVVIDRNGCTRLKRENWSKNGWNQISRRFLVCANGHPARWIILNLILIYYECVFYYFNLLGGYWGRVHPVLVDKRFRLATQWQYAGDCFVWCNDGAIRILVRLVVSPGWAMRNISFSITRFQFCDRTKTVTRRLGWAKLKPGDVLMGVEKAMGLKKGESKTNFTRSGW